MSDDRPTVIYRYRALDDGRLIYVGTSGSAHRDWGHENGSPWWSFCGPPETEWYPTKSAALAAEREAIRNERPLFNNKGRPNGGPSQRERYQWLTTNIRRALGTLPEGAS